MMKHKTVKITILIVAISVVAVGLVTLAIFVMYELALFLYKDSMTYREYDPDKMGVYLEQRYNIDFPDNVETIKAARTGESWDGWSGFIVKFAAKPADVQRFLASIPRGAYILRPYTRNQDKRLKLLAPYTPKWYTAPIEAGKMGYVKVEVLHIKNIGFTIDLYIDTSDDKEYVVYLHGTYRSSID